MRIPVKTLPFAFMVLILCQVADAMSGDRSMASKAAQVECRHSDGDGTYIGRGDTLHSARSSASEQCFNRKLDMYAARHGGAVPDDLQSDLIMDACVNICRK